MRNEIMKKIEQQIQDSRFLNPLLTTFKVALSTSVFAVPFIKLLDEVLPGKRFSKLEKFAEDLANDLQRLEDKIDVEYITTEEFGYLFESCLKLALDSYNKEKIDSFRSIIVASTIEHKNINIEEIEFFINITKGFTVIHIKLIRFLSSPDVSIINGERNFDEIIYSKFNQHKRQIIKTAFHDLYECGLINYDKSLLKTFTKLETEELFRNMMTNLGKNYMKFVRELK